MLLIPGVDGLNMEAVDQFDILSASFDVWSMRVGGNDESTFVELTEKVGRKGPAIANNNVEKSVSEFACPCERTHMVAVWLPLL